VINWIEQKLAASYRTPGGHRRIRREDLLAFLRKHQIPTPAPLVDEKFNLLIVEDEEEITKILTNLLRTDRRLRHSLRIRRHLRIDAVGRSKAALADTGYHDPWS